MKASFFKFYSAKKIHRLRIKQEQMPAVMLELNDCWYGRMTNDKNVTYIFEKAVY